MRKVVFVAAGVLLALVCCAVAGAAAVSVTLEGNIVCAKCTLKVEGVDKCQSVLLVKNAAGQDAQYWLARNAVGGGVGVTVGVTVGAWVGAAVAVGVEVGRVGVREGVGRGVGLAAAS